jgi:hypothetical protein
MKSPASLAHVCAITLVAFGIAACSPEKFHHAMHKKHATQSQAASHANPQATTYSMQDDSSAWKRSPHMHAFYDATVATFANGTDIDVDAYEAKSFALFREFARANGASEQGMLDHLKLIPRQVVSIVKENPGVLKSYDAFWIAMVGPD